MHSATRRFAEHFATLAWTRICLWQLSYLHEIFIMAKINSEPLWQATSDIPQFPKLTRAGSFDVVVIGGGITGLTAAYLLKRAGKKVCLVERYRLGFVDTGLTTAHVTYVTDERLPRLVKDFGEEAAARVSQAGAHAIDTIEAITKVLDIDCEFRRVPGFLHEAIGAKKDESADFKKEADLADKLGFPGKFVEHVPYFNRPGIRFPDQAKFHPLKYLAGLARAVDGQGSKIYEQSEVAEVKEKPLRVVIGKHELETEYVVIATHVPLMGKTGTVNAALFQTKLYPYSSYVIGAKIPRGVIPDASFWDTNDPYYYLRVEPGKKFDYAIFGGKDHKTGQEQDTQQRFDELRETLLSIIPKAKPDRQWSGQVIETNDGLPYIGETAEKQFAATGYAGNGITFGTIAGVMARDAALGKENPWQQLFSPNRKKIRGGTWDYVKENLDYPYYYVKDRLTRGEQEEPSSLKPGEGKVLILDGERVACCRDEEGKLNTVSAVCTHMGCLVRWNGAEQTWDCPCHGSRFKPDGKVLAGPAESNLEEHDFKEAQTKPAKKSTKKKPTKKKSET
jgi:glycine/D-amino acid oxidase-like deaminating enzyme/nitrite reductase/ring-hydroxylating ferredoxin subunit